MRAQNASGSALASARSFSSSAIDLMWAFSEKAGGGGKTRSSVCSDSMFVVVDDMPVPLLARSMASMAALCIIEKLDAPLTNYEYWIRLRALLETIHYWAPTVAAIATTIVAISALCVYRRNFAWSAHDGLQSFTEIITPKTSLRLFATSWIALRILMR